MKAAWHECLGRTKRRGARGGRRPRCRPDAAPRRQKARLRFPVSCPGAAAAPAPLPPPRPCRPPRPGPEAGKRRPRAGGPAAACAAPGRSPPARAAASPAAPRPGPAKFLPQFPSPSELAPAGRGGTPGQGAEGTKKAASTCCLPSRRVSGGGGRGGRAPEKPRAPEAPRGGRKARLFCQPRIPLPPEPGGDGRWAFFSLLDVGRLEEMYLQLPFISK